jgi:hypothetical protein
MCATSAECRTIMTAVLMVMSGMDPHTIRETKIAMVGMFGVWLVLCLDRTAIVDSVVRSMSRFKKKKC